MVIWLPIRGLHIYICVKNISGRKIEIEDRVYYRFDYKEVRKKDEFGRYYLEMANTVPYEEVWSKVYFLDMQTQKSAFAVKAQLMPGEEYLVKISWNGARELMSGERYFTECVSDILSEHDFKYLQLRIRNFANLTIRPSTKEDDYAWYVSDKEVCQNYGVYVPVTSTPKTSR